MKIAFSPCPNDTFVFHALVHGLVPGAPEFDVTFADVDVTNTAALDGRFDLVKVSYAALPWLLEDYRLVPCGGALGRGCGPLVVTRPGQRIETVAVPGDRTTAYLLFRLWASTPYQIKVIPFNEIMPGVASGRFDAGLVIHEARFTYQRYGLTSVVDLGQWWEEQTGLPIPLGAIIARPSLVDDATGWIRQSVRMAWADPAMSRDFVKRHAQEMDDDVIDGHISLYVNNFTEDLGAEGREAARVLLTRAADANLVPAVDL
ncbi:1,4-dihydroxy-6-naphthoate synthase [Allorhizocola rhizosphaerae]|uniref:1,4-dihydroxy-6-naphthoate synthase n=1 Tax=Allorhizocola rhizosphaerae TaxID=1872709 RepID=UPI000E3B7809|nr:1,4-dihydroxy-6-naphthoate synthase [Allorhizocola rhizosphaerae]